MAMQSHLGLKFEGRLHSGIDDCRNNIDIFPENYAGLQGSFFSLRNILAVMKSLVDKGAKLSNNGMTKK